MWRVECDSQSVKNMLNQEQNPRKWGLSLV